jgi:2-polyprenyl-6-hydroxyphenyl methylase/3-demethylubiquinone-9 3-methyltransferase
MALRDEWERLGRPLTILDMGCGRGVFREYVGETVPARWIGLDWRLNPMRLLDAGYDELLACDLDKPLPVADETADVVVCLHVLEHLPRPGSALLETARVLRPGGVLVAASPAAPVWVGFPREMQLRHQLRRGRRRPGKHVNCFWPGRWRGLVRSAGLELEVLTGAYLLRWAGIALEDSRVWARVNQLWGALFPSLGGELCVTARSAIAAGVPALQPTAERRAPGRIPRRFLRRAGAIAAALLVAMSLLLAWPESDARAVARLARTHQDGNDVFYVLPHPSIGGAEGTHDLPVLRCLTDLPEVLARDQEEGRDVHLLVAEEQLRLLADLPHGFRVVGRTQVNRTRFYLLGREGYGEPLPG